MSQPPQTDPPLLTSRHTRTVKAGYFVLEGLNSLGTVLYFYYLYFFMQQQFGFGNGANLALAALNGFIYMLASFWAGKFAQRAGYFTALKLGFIIMPLSLAAGMWSKTSTGQIVAMSATVFGMCFTWPTLEALVSEGEGPETLPRMVGIYNVVWAGTGAVAYFIGGAMIATLGLKSIFFVPVLIQLGQLALTFWLESAVKSASAAATHPQKHASEQSVPQLTPPSLDKAKTFLRLAWLANPFAYIAINTLVAVMPGIAKRLELSTMLAGFCGSLWCFARFGSFFAFWFWTGWHYRFRWLLCAYIALAGSFALVVLAPNLTSLLAAQLFFGSALGLIYYSSLFYSMDASPAKGEHGGIHEAAIGFGNFAGPAVGAVSLYFLPNHANTGVIAVSTVLVGGLVALLALWRVGSKR
jgi:predicted MFS family arabinose efflux permease